MERIILSERNEKRMASHDNRAKQNEILKKRISSMVLKEISRGLSRNETLLKQASIRQLYAINHQINK